MKLRQLTIALSMVGASSVGLVGCGGSSNSYNEIVTYEGVAIDGYLANAMVCADDNGNKQCDAGEDYALTDGEGNFELTTASTAPLVLVPTDNTTDITTGQTFSAGEFFLTAPSGAETITPLTTLAQVQSEVEGVSYAAAQADVVDSLGLPEGTDLEDFDYVAEQQAGSDAAAEIHVVAQMIRESIQDNLETIEDAGSDASDNAQALSAAYILIAPPESGGTILDEFVTVVDAEGITAESDIATVVADADVVSAVDDNAIEEDEVDSVVGGIEDAVDNGGSGGEPIDGVTGGTGGTSEQF